MYIHLFGIMSISIISHFENLLKVGSYEKFCSQIINLPSHVLELKNEQGKSLVHLLVDVPETGWRNMALALLNHDHLTSLEDENGNKCIHLLVERGYASSVNVLRLRIDAKKLTVSTNNSRDNVFHIAARHCDCSTLRELLLTQYHPNVLTAKNKDGNSPIREAVKACNVNAITLLGTAYKHLQESVRDEFFRYKQSLLFCAVETNNALVVRKVLELYYTKAYRHWDDCILGKHLGTNSVLDSYHRKNYPNSMSAIMRFYIDNPRYTMLKVLYHIIDKDDLTGELLFLYGSKRKTFYHLLVEVGAGHALSTLRRFYPNVRTRKNHNLLHTFALSDNPTLDVLKILHAKMGDDTFIALIDQHCVEGCTPIQYLETNKGEEVESCLQYMREAYGISNNTEF